MCKLAFYALIVTVLSTYSSFSSFLPEEVSSSNPLPRSSPIIKLDTSYLDAKFSALEEGIQNLQQRMPLLTTDDPLHKAHVLLKSDLKNMGLATIYITISYLSWQIKYFTSVSERTDSRFFVKEELQPVDKFSRFPSILTIPSGAAGLYYLARVSLIHNLALKPFQNMGSLCYQILGKGCNTLARGWYKLSHFNTNSNKQD